jgi:predicted N-acetyltransferase YhbS
MTMVTIRQERRSDVPAREALLDAALGEARFKKASERLREGRSPAEGLSFVATENGRVIGTVRLWPVSAGRNRPALLLGPLAVAAEARNRGVGTALMRRALRDAGRRGYGALVLVGDAPYYGRFGFSAEKTGALWLPGPTERHRLLACELVPGALHGAHGLINPSRPVPSRAGLSKLMAQVGLGKRAAVPQPAYSVDGGLR